MYNVKTLLLQIPNMMLFRKLSIITILLLLTTKCNSKDTVDFFKTIARTQSFDDDHILNVFVNSTDSSSNNGEKNYSKLNTVSMKFSHPVFDNSSTGYVSSIQDLEEHFGHVEKRNLCLGNLTKCIEEGKIFYLITKSVFYM